jgi:hypothetical protein
MEVAKAQHLKTLEYDSGRLIQLAAELSLHDEVTINQTEPALYEAAI